MITPRNNMKQKLALFDFCETIIQFQTADGFIDFIRDKTNSRLMKRLELVRIFLAKIKFFGVLFNKEKIHSWE